MCSWFVGASRSANLQAGLGGRSISTKSPKTTDRTKHTGVITIIYELTGETCVMAQAIADRSV
jgi:hypothetical protein